MRKLSVLLVLWVGMAWGQTGTITSRSPTFIHAECYDIGTSTGVLWIRWSDGSVTGDGSVTRVADGQLPSSSNLPKCVYPKSATIAVDRHEEPLDVPAISLSIKDEPNGPPCYVDFGCAPFKQWCQYGTHPTVTACSEHPTFHWKRTCKDNHRILEHDEQTPPVYWCRKVQSEKP